MNNELQALQNGCDYSKIPNMKVHEKYFEDKRKTGKKYFLTIEGTTISPVLNYDNMNHFILGFLKAKEFLTEKA